MGNTSCLAKLGGMKAPSEYCTASSGEETLEAGGVCIVGKQKGAGELGLLGAFPSSASIVCEENDEF